MKKNLTSIFKNIFTVKTLFNICIIALIIYFLYKCPFEYILGICCPGCGMTRAFLSLLKLDISAAFHYHPLFPLVIIIAIYMILRQLHIFSFSPRTTNILLYVICALFFLVYFIRLFSVSPVVYADFGHGLISKFIGFIFSY